MGAPQVKERTNCGTPPKNAHSRTLHYPLRMTGSEHAPRAHRPMVALAVLIAAVLVVLSATVVIPPPTMGLFPLAVGSSEMSVFLALLDLVWALVALRVLRERRVLRAAMLVALGVGVVIAIRPMTQFRAVAESASAQLGSEESEPQFSMLTALRGLPTNPYVVTRVIPYAAADRTPLTMRLHALDNPDVKPLVVVIYGGAWRGGDPAQAENVSRALASRGFAVAAIDYRHAPQFQYPAQLDDVRRALALLRDSAAAWKLSAEHIALLGRLSGGHLAELAAYAPGDRPVQAVVALYAPHDLVQGYRDVPSPDPIGVRAVLTGFLGGSPDQQLARYQEASPSSYVRPGLPPTLLVFGSRDNIVKPEFNRGAAASLRRANVQVVSVELPWAEHAFDLVPAGLGAQLTFQVVTRFLDRELRR
jgi:acetyl esterase/lipase